MQRSQMPTETDDWKKRSKSKKGKKTFKVEYRMRPEAMRSWSWPRWGQWEMCHKKYRTAQERAGALVVLNRKDTLFEYRIPEEETR